MPITEQQAIEWAGTATADELTKVHSPRPDGRLTVEMVQRMVSITTEVAHCFVTGGAQAPILAIAETTVEAHPFSYCQQVLRRNAGKLETMEGLVDSPHTRRAHKNAAADPSFMAALGHREGITTRNGAIPYLRLMFDPTASALMHSYILETLGLMMHGGTSRNNFIPILWAGVRDWETSSAWTRGVVLLYAKRYKHRVEERHGRHLQTQEEDVNTLLKDLGLDSEQQLHSLAHLPSLTGRQARRSGVSERALRLRWA